MGLVPSIVAATQSASVIAKAVTTTGGTTTNTSGLDAASVSEEKQKLKADQANQDAQEETSTPVSSGNAASRSIFNSNRPATQSPFPVSPTATSSNSSQQAPMMPPMGMGGMGSIPKLPDLPKPNPKDNEPWKGNGAKEEGNKPPELTPPSETAKATEVTDKKKIAALNEAFDTKNSGAADLRKALLFIYTNAKDKNSESLSKSLADPVNQELLAKHYNPAHIHKDENGKITVNGQDYNPKSPIAPLIDIKFTKPGAFITAKAGDGKFKETEVKGESLDTKKLIAAKNSNDHFIDVHTEPVIDRHLGDQGFQDYLEKSSKKNEDLLNLLKIYKNPNKTPTDPKADIETLGNMLHKAWTEYINQ